MNNCQTCKHKQNPDGGHCYMFRVEPQEPCMQHTIYVIERRHHPPSPETRGDDMNTKLKVPPALRALRKFTIEQAAQAMGVHHTTAARRLTKLRLQRKIHIHSYAEDALGRACVLVFRVGKGVDAQPNPVSGAERARRHRQRQQQKKEAT